MLYPIILKVSTIILVVQDFFHSSYGIDGPFMDDLDWFTIMMISLKKIGYFPQPREIHPPNMAWYSTSGLEGPEMLV